MVERIVDSQGVKQENTGWRDQAISDRHRAYGFNMPAVDIDFLLVEYDTSKPKALIDYKKHTSVEGNTHSSAYKAMSGLYDSSGNLLPCFVVHYWPGMWAFAVKPKNNTAIQYWDSYLHKFGDTTNRADPVNERMFVGFLAYLRGRGADMRWAWTNEQFNTILPSDMDDEDLI